MYPLPVATQVEVPAAACRGRSARRAVVILRARSYPALFGGMFAAPQLTFVPPPQKYLFEASGVNHSGSGDSSGLC